MSIKIQLKDDRSEDVNYNTDYPVYIKRSFLSSYPKYCAPGHWHDDVEFILVKKGHMDYNINGEHVSINCGEGLFVNSRQMHFGYSESKTECDFVCILLKPDLLCGVEKIKKELVEAVTDNPSFCYVVLKNDVPWQKSISDCLEKLYDRCESKTLPLVALGLFSLVLSELYEHRPKAEYLPAVADRDLAAFKEMCGFIKNHYSERVSLADIARAGNMGESKCCRMFHLYTAKTPNTYLLEYRLGKGAELLKGSDSTITSVALKVGFCSASYFAESFHEWSGLTPSQYRNKK